MWQRAFRTLTFGFLQAVQLAPPSKAHCEAMFSLTKAKASLSSRLIGPSSAHTEPVSAQIFIWPRTFTVLNAQRKTTERCWKQKRCVCVCEPQNWAPCWVSLVQSLFWFCLFLSSSCRPANPFCQMLHHVAHHVAPSCPPSSLFLAHFNSFFTMSHPNLIDFMPIASESTILTHRTYLCRWEA